MPDQPAADPGSDGDRWRIAADAIDAYLTTLTRLGRLIDRFVAADKEILETVVPFAVHMTPDQFALLNKLGARHVSLREEFAEALQTMATQYADMVDKIARAEP